MMRLTGLLLGSFLAALTVVQASGADACSSPTCTKIIDNGSDSGKKVVVVMGDGYTSSEQSLYNQKVTELVLEGLFGHDFFLENENAFNVYRLNLESTESGVSSRQWDEKGTPNDSGDDVIVSTTMKDTALRYIYSGSWAHCWLEHDGSTTNQRKNDALDDNDLSHADYIIVFLNRTGGGGCNRGPRDIVQTHSVAWTTVAHESGHGIMGLRDEYTRRNEDYPGSAINNSNCSTMLDRAGVFWNRYVDPDTQVPTVTGAGIDENRDVGLFEGCLYSTRKIYRPVHRCRMNNNTPNWDPVCQNIGRERIRGNIGHTFERAVAGDFDGDGRDDVLIQNDDDWAIYRAGTNPMHLDLVWVANNNVPGTGSLRWPISSSDELHVADFDGDGRDDVFVINRSRWWRPYYVMLRSDGIGLQTIRYGYSIGGYGYVGSNDQIFVADFDHDGKDDLYLFSGSSYDPPYLAMVKSYGTYVGVVRRYDGSVPGSPYELTSSYVVSTSSLETSYSKYELTADTDTRTLGYRAGWSLKPGDRFLVGDFDNDGREDLYVFNSNDWSNRYFAMIRSTGAALATVKTYNTSLPGWTMTSGDKHLVADFDGDGMDDVYVFNGTNWSVTYLAMFESTGGSLTQVRRYDSGVSPLPGWALKRGDTFYVSDANKDGKADLFAYNPATDYTTEYLGTLLSSGSSLSGSWSQDWVSGIPGAGGWNLGRNDRLIPVNYEGGLGKAGLFIRNTNWFGMIRRDSSRFVMDRHYNEWIYTPLYDSKPWQRGMP